MTIEDSETPLWSFNDGDRMAAMAARQREHTVASACAAVGVDTELTAALTRAALLDVSRPFRRMPPPVLPLNWSGRSIAVLRGLAEDVGVRCEGGWLKRDYVQAIEQQVREINEYRDFLTAVEGGSK